MLLSRLIESLLKLIEKALTEQSVRSLT